MVLFCLLYFLLLFIFHPFDWRYKDGKILVINALSKKDQVIHSLKGHNDEVQSLVWAPYLGEDAFLKTKPGETDPASDQGCLLISGKENYTRHLELFYR